jgi:hypothetical protein
MPAGEVYITQCGKQYNTFNLIVLSSFLDFPRARCWEVHPSEDMSKAHGVES